MQNKSYTLGEIAKLIGAELQGDADTKISSIASLEKASMGQISFLVSSRYQLVASTRHEKLLPSTKASAVLLSPDHASNCPTQMLLMNDPYQGLVRLLDLFQKKSNAKAGIHPTAVIGEDTYIAPSVTIGPHCVIGNNCHIGENTVLKAHTVIDDHVKIGQDCVFYPHVTVYHDVTFGDRVVVHAGAVIGSDGFGLIRDPQGWKKIPHVGSVIIGNDVEIGASTTIDRGSLDDTVLENGVKLDNQIQVAHGVVIGENTVIAGCTGIAGSTRIGKNCMVGGLTGFADNITIADGVIFTGMAQVVKSIKEPGVYSSGTGILPRKEWHKATARLHNLDNLAKKVRNLENENEE